MRKDLDNNKTSKRALGRARKVRAMRVSEGVPEFLPDTQVIFSSDTIYFNIHINIYEQENIIIYIHRDALRITKLASDIYDILRGYYKK